MQKRESDLRPRVSYPTSLGSAVSPLIGWNFLMPSVKVYQDLPSPAKSNHTRVAMTLFRYVSWAMLWPTGQHAFEQLGLTLTKQIVWFLQLHVNVLTDIGLAKVWFCKRNILYRACRGILQKSLDFLLVKRSCLNVIPWVFLPLVALAFGGSRNSLSALTGLSFSQC